MDSSSEFWNEIDDNKKYKFPCCCFLKREYIDSDDEIPFLSDNEFYQRQGIVQKCGNCCLAFLYCILSSWCCCNEKLMELWCCVNKQLCTLCLPQIITVLLTVCIVVVIIVTIVVIICVGIWYITKNLKLKDVLF